jgi:hypothetical protein
MGLNSRRRLYSTTFVVITATVYITALVLLFSLSAPENEIVVDDLERFERTIQTRAQDKKLAGIVRQNIRAFESSYLAVRPRESKEIYKEQNETALKKELFKKYSFNALESSKIGLERKIPDNRRKK